MSFRKRNGKGREKRTVRLQN